MLMLAAMMILLVFGERVTPRTVEIEPMHVFSIEQA